MTISYNLSIYSIEFVALTSQLSSIASTKPFKLRFINQQTTSFVDSSQLTLRQINQNANIFPIFVVVKGGQSMFFKVKIVEGEKAVGEGVANINRKNLNKSLRVVLYEKLKKEEQVAVCMVDLFISGFSFDNSQEKIIQERESESQDAVYSQMSYTKHEKQSDQENQVFSGIQHSRENIIDKISQSKQKEKVYQQIISQKSFKRSLTQSSKSSKLKHRRKTLKIEQNQFYNPQSQFIKYFQKIQHPTKILKNISFKKTIQKHNQNQTSNKQEQTIQIQKMLIKDHKSKQKNAQISFRRYRAYCNINYQKQKPIQVILNAGYESMDIVVQSCQGNFQGVIGLQLGEKMCIKMFPEDYDQQNDQVYLLYFDIRQSYEKGCGHKFLEKQEVDQRQENRLKNMSIKERISNYSNQPWGYMSQNSIKQSPLEKYEAEKQKKYQISRPNSTQQRNSKILPSIEKSKRNYHTQEKKQKKNLKSFDSISMIKYLGNQDQLNKKFKTSSNSISSNSQKKQAQRYTVQPLSNAHKRRHTMTESKSSFKKKQAILLDSDYYSKKSQEQKYKKLWQKLLINSQIQADLNLQNKPRIKEKTIPHHIKIPTLRTTLNKSSFKSTVSNKIYKKAVDIQQDKNYQPLRHFQLEIKNISTTIPWQNVDDSGQFIKIFLQKKVNYYTEIVFNEDCNSILWRLQGCKFSQLIGPQIIKIQIFRIQNNRSYCIGQSQIRVSKLFFIRNNHIYNGIVKQNGEVWGEYTIGFEIQQNFTFDVIEEEDESNLQTLVKTSKKQTIQMEVPFNENNQQ